MTIGGVELCDHWSFLLFTGVIRLQIKRRKLHQLVFGVNQSYTYDYTNIIHNFMNMPLEVY